MEWTTNLNWWVSRISSICQLYNLRSLGVSRNREKGEGLRWEVESSSGFGSKKRGGGFQVGGFKSFGYTKITLPSSSIIYL